MPYLAKPREHLQGSLHGGCTAIERQQAGVDVERAAAWDVKEGLWQDVAVCRRDAEIWLQSS